jgi:hypothetical protein
VVFRGVGRGIAELVGVIRDSKLGDVDTPAPCLLVVLVLPIKCHRPCSIRVTPGFFALLVALFQGPWSGARARTDIPPARIDGLRRGGSCEDSPEERARPHVGGRGRVEMGMCGAMRKGRTSRIRKDAI